MTSKSRFLSCHSRFIQKFRLTKRNVINYDYQKVTSILPDHKFISGVKNHFSGCPAQVKFQSGQSYISLNVQRESRKKYSAR